jgi:hypothetical protein
VTQVLELDRATIYDALDLFVYGDDGTRYVRTYARGEVSYSGRELYSYGRHFPLVRFVPSSVRGRDSSGRRRPDLFVINGDEWNGRGGWHPSRTPSHQEMVRARCSGYSGAESVILPFSALTGAGLELDSVRVIHVRDDARWTETLEARTLAELPRHERKTSYQVELTARTLEELPRGEREHYRPYTDSERAELERERGAGAYIPPSSYLPRLPDSDGLYRWTETRYRDLEPDSDGLYRWTVNRHRLGDSLISAIRPETSSRRARPFEASASSRNWTLELVTDERGRGASCEASEDRRHESGAGSSCVHCGAELFAVETWRRRALYLSSFDLNESPPLYFLAEVPRGARPTTVEQALDALAPRAVHAAIARGRHVARQGDIFFIDTDLDRAELEARGAVFGRLTLWTRDAKPRAGEFGATPKLTAAQRRRRAARERGYARRVFSATMRGELERDSWHEARELARELTRAKHAELWRDLRARHAHELAAANGDSSQLAPCSDCGAGAAVACGEDCIAARRGWRAELGAAHKRQRDELKRDTSAPDARYSRPESGADGRRRAARNRVKVLDELADARETLRRAVFKAPGPTRHSPTGYRYSSPISHVIEARKRYETLAARARELELVPCLGLRDGYRSHGRGRALETWRRALELAQRKYRPETVFDTDRFRARRELARRACAIYGTAHSATELAHVRGAVYVRGTVSHVPGLEPDRFGGPDHRPLTLTAGRWYLAVRNTVPRQSRRRRRASSRRAV